MKRVPPLGDRLINSESFLEHLGPESPSDSEVSLFSDCFIGYFPFKSVLYLMYILKQADDQILKLDKPEVKRQTLVDRFQEALSDRTLVTVPKTLRYTV